MLDTLLSVPLPLLPRKSWDGIIRYNGWPINYRIYNADDGIWIYIKPELDNADNGIKVDCILGIINQNGNLCRKSPLKHTFTHDNNSLWGHRLNLIVTPLSLESYRQSDDTIRFGISWKLFDVSFNNDRILRAIYHSTKADLVDKLKEDITRLQDKVTRYEEDITKLKDENDSVHNALTAALNEQILASSPETSIHVHIPAPATASVHEHKHESGPEHVRLASRVDVSNMTREELLKLETLIKDALTDLQTCVVCKSAEINCTISPCGHHRCCITCASCVEVCPVCRSNIEQRVRTF